MTIDDLAHAAELEAEVLRAVSHLSPAAAQEFLMSIILKIRRAASVKGATAKGVTLPRVLASTVVEQRRPTDPPPLPSKTLEAVEAPSYVRGSRTRAVIDLIRVRGELTAGEIKTAIAGPHGLERNRVHSTITYLVERGVLTRVGEKFALATLDPPEVKEVV